MAWSESKAWREGTANQKFYQALLDDASTAPARNAKRRKVIHPEEMPWEMSRQGLLKHLINEGMNTRMETVDAYMQIIPPGSKSGKHRHLAEECLYVLEGQGYDLHQDCDVEITDTYHWTPQAEVKRYEWEAGDVIYIPPNTIHQHHNASGDKPVRLISVINRIFKACGLNDLEQLENAPEYDPAVVLNGEIVDAYLRGRVPTTTLNWDNDRSVRTGERERQHRWGRVLAGARSGAAQRGAGSPHRAPVHDRGRGPRGAAARRRAQGRRRRHLHLAQYQGLGADHAGLREEVRRQDELWRSSSERCCSARSPKRAPGATRATPSS